MITCSSKGNYRKQPTWSGRLEGTREPSLPGYLTIPAPTGNAEVHVLPSRVQSGWDRGSTTTLHSAGTWRSCRRRRRHLGKATMLLQRPSPDTFPSERSTSPMEAEHHGHKRTWAQHLPQPCPGSSPKCLPTPLGSRGAPSPFTAEKQRQSWRGALPRQQKAGPQVSRNSSAHFEPGTPKPRHQAQCLKTAEAACRQLQKAPY